jgi:hypothetical protein
MNHPPEVPSVVEDLAESIQLTYETAGEPTYGNLAIDTDDLQRLAEGDQRPGPRGCAAPQVPEKDARPLRRLA